MEKDCGHVTAPLRTLKARQTSSEELRGHGHSRGVALAVVHHLAAGDGVAFQSQLGMDRTVHASRAHRVGARLKRLYKQ